MFSLLSHTKSFSFIKAQQLWGNCILLFVFFLPPFSHPAFLQCVEKLNPYGSSQLLGGTQVAFKRHLGFRCPILGSTRSNTAVSAVLDLPELSVT